MKKPNKEPKCPKRPDHRYIERVIFDRRQSMYYLQCVYCGYRPH